MGCGQVVRHQVLVLAFGGSNPSIPAIRNEARFVLRFLYFRPCYFRYFQEF